jgi:hypothetical protein
VEVTGAAAEARVVQLERNLIGECIFTLQMGRFFKSIMVGFIRESDS